MKYFIAILFCFLSTLAFSQGAGIRYMDTIPTHTPNPALRHSVVVYNTTNDTYYHHQDGKWKDLGILRVVDSTLQILNEQYSLGDRILVKSTGEQFLVQTDSFFLVDSIYSVPLVGSNYAVWQPGFNHQGEFVLDTIDSGDYKLQIGGDVLINKNPLVTLSLESSLAAIYSARASTQSGIAFLVDYDVDSLAAWSISATMRDLYIGGGPGDILINNQSGNVPFLIKQNPSDSAFTINAQGEVLINQREFDAGSYKLQVNGSTWLGGETVFAPSDTQDITAGSGITVTNTIMRVQGSGGAVDITANPQIADGNDGEIVILEGMSDTNTLTLDDGTGLQLAGAASFVMGIGDVIQLMYNANRDLWIEITRSNN